MTTDTKQQGHTKECVSGNQGAEWSGAEAENGKGWICDECGEFIPLEATHE